MIEHLAMRRMLELLSSCPGQVLGAQQANARWFAATLPQEKLRQLMHVTDLIALGAIDRAQQIAQGLLLFTRHQNRDQLAGSIATHQAQRVEPIGFYPLS